MTLGEGGGVLTGVRGWLREAQCGRRRLGMASAGRKGLIGVVGALEHGVADSSHSEITMLGGH